MSGYEVYASIGGDIGIPTILKVSHCVGVRRVPLHVRISPQWSMCDWEAMSYVLSSSWFVSGKTRGTHTMPNPNTPILLDVSESHEFWLVKKRSDQCIWIWRNIPLTVGVIRIPGFAFGIDLVCCHPHWLWLSVSGWLVWLLSGWLAPVGSTIQLDGMSQTLLWCLSHCQLNHAMLCLLVF